jgi:ADP-heptose:LPS heptosyltransferase
VLVGAGVSETDALLSSDRPDLTALWSPGGSLPEWFQLALGPGTLAVAYTRSDEVRDGLARLAERVLAWDPAPPPNVHASEWLARPLAELGLHAPATIPSLVFSDGERQAARAWSEKVPRHFLAVHPGSGSPRKNWPAERFARLADAIAPAEPFLVIEGPADATAAGPLLHHPRAIRVAGVSPRTLGALLAQAGTFVGNDSGVAHLAAAAGAPTVAVFGPTDPAQWAPVGTAVVVVRAASARLEDVSVDEVRAAAGRLAT